MRNGKCEGKGRSRLMESIQNATWFEGQNFTFWIKDAWEKHAD